MFEPEPEFASDLEFMLQGGAEPIMLAEALLEAFYLPVYRVALAETGEAGAGAEFTGSEAAGSEAAGLLALDAFRLALQNLHRYRAGRSPRAWMFSQLLPGLNRRPPPARPASPAPPPDEATAAIWAAVDRLDPTVRQLVHLALLGECSPAELGELAGRPETELAAWLETTTAQLLPENGLPGAERQGRLAAALLARWPAEGLPPEQLGPLARELAGWAAASRRRARLWVTLQELALVAVVIALAAGGLWLSGRLEPDPAPTPVARRNDFVTQYPATPLPTPTTSPTPRPFPYPPDPSNVFYTVKRGDSLAEVVSQMNTSPSELFELNRLPAGAALIPGQRLLIPGRLPTSVPPATPPTPAPVRLEPLQVDSPHEDIARRLGEARLGERPLFLDAWMVYYGPLAYHGPPQEYRLQAWIGRGMVLELGGPLGLAPAQALLVRDAVMYLANPGLDNPWFHVQPNRTMPLVNPLIPLMETLVSSGLGRASPEVLSRWTVEGTTVIAGRRALFITQPEPEKSEVWLVWLDAETGLPLRQQRYRLPPGADTHDRAALRPENVIFESGVSRVELDFELPASLLDPYLPWRGDYAANASGQPATPADRPVPVRAGLSRASLTLPDGPPGLVLQDAPLTLHSLNRYNLFSAYPDGWQIQVSELYANQADLGIVALPNPAFMLCARSPDGRRLVFSIQSQALAGMAFAVQTPRLFWLNLGELEVQHYPDPLVLAGDFAFAPDNKTLAFFGQPEGASMPAVYLLDLDAGKFRLLKALTDVHSLVFSPDGQQLALLYTEYAGTTGTEVVVLDTATGDEVFRREVDVDQEGMPLAADPDWPTASWGVPFPRPPGTWDTCATPPR